MPAEQGAARDPTEERQGEDAAARLVLQDAAARFPDDARTHERLGDHCWARGDLIGARLGYLRALHTEPDQPWSLELKLAEAYSALDDRTAALRFHRAAHLHAPDEPATLVGLAQALRAPALRAESDPGNDEEFCEAYGLLEDGLKRFPESGSVLVCAAQSVPAMGHYDDGLELLRRAVALEPDHPFAARLLAEFERVDWDTPGQDEERQS